MAFFVLEQNLLYSLILLEVSSARLNVVTYTCNISLEKTNVGRLIQVGGQPVQQKQDR